MSEYMLADLHPSAVEGVTRFDFEDGYTQDDMGEAADLSRIFSDLLMTLTPREERVLRLRYYDDKTLEDVANEFDLTRERIRQIEMKALRKFRHSSRAKLLKPYAGVTDIAKPYTSNRRATSIDVRVRVTIPPSVGEPFANVGLVRNNVMWRKQMAADIDGQWVFVRATGWTDTPEVCADFNDTDLVIFFEHGGQRYGEDWRGLKRINPARYEYVKARH